MAYNSLVRQQLGYASAVYTPSIDVAPITQLRMCVMKIVHIQGKSPDVVSDFPYHKELVLKERIHSLWEQILSFKRSSNFKKGRNWRESLPVPVVSLWCA